MSHTGLTHLLSERGVQTELELIALPLGVLDVEHLSVTDTANVPAPLAQPLRLPAEVLDDPRNQFRAGRQCSCRSVNMTATDVTRRRTTPLGSRGRWGDSMPRDAVVRPRSAVATGP